MKERNGWVCFANNMLCTSRERRPRTHLPFDMGVIYTCSPTGPHLHGPKQHGFKQLGPILPISVGYYLEVHITNWNYALMYLLLIIVFKTQRHE